VLISRLISDCVNVVCWCRYTNVSVGAADVEEGLGVSKPVFPHEVIKSYAVCYLLGKTCNLIQLYFADNRLSVPEYQLHRLIV